MKIVNEKGKLFGLVNLVDLFVILAVLLGIAGVSWRVLGDTARDRLAPQVEMTVVTRIRGASVYLTSELERNPLTGKQMVAGNSYIDAVITEFRFEDYIAPIATDDGRFITAVDSDRKDIVITFTAKIPRGTPTPKVGTQEVRVGRTMLIKTRDFEVNASIESMIIKE